MKGKGERLCESCFPSSSRRKCFQDKHTAPTKQRGLISLEGVPCGQDRTEHCALPESSQNFTQSWETQTVSNSKFLCSQKHTQLWSSLLQVITKAWEIQLPLSQTVFDSLLITIMSISRRCRVGFLQQRPWGKKKRLSSYSILKLIPYISAFSLLSKIKNSDLAGIIIKQFSTLCHTIYFLCAWLIWALVFCTCCEHTQIPGTFKSGWWSQMYLYHLHGQTLNMLQLPPL